MNVRDGETDVAILGTQARLCSYVKHIFGFDVFGGVIYRVRIVNLLMSDVQS